MYFKFYTSRFYALKLSTAIMIIYQNQCFLKSDMNCIKDKNTHLIVFKANQNYQNF